MIVAAPATQDDVAILERIARRDPDGLASLYDRYGGLAFSYAYHLLRERDAAEDAVHDGVPQHLAMRRQVRRATACGAHLAANDRPSPGHRER